jgi:hypothetical protein
MGTMHLATTQGASVSGNGDMRQQCLMLVAIQSLLLMVGFLSIEFRGGPGIDSCGELQLRADSSNGLLFGVLADGHNARTSAEHDKLPSCG